MSEQREGVWIAYGWDMHPYDVRPFRMEIEALRFAQEGGYFTHVLFVPFGESLEGAEAAARATPAAEPTKERSE